MVTMHTYKTNPSNDYTTASKLFNLESLKNRQYSTGEARQDINSQQTREIGFLHNQLCFTCVGIPLKFEVKKNHISITSVALVCNTNLSYRLQKND